MLAYTPMKIDAVFALIILLVLFLAVYVHRQQAAASAEKKEAGLGLGKLINDVKADLMKTERDGTAEMFRVKTFDLEVNFVVREREGAQAGVSYQVVTLGGETEFSTEKVQKITLHMDAVAEEEKGPATNPILDNPPPDKQQSR